jgi:Sulfotransferase family
MRSGVRTAARPGAGARIVKRSMSERRLVFVGGLHRSGTTLLARALTAHPEIVGFSNTGVVEDEGQYLQSVYPSDAISGGAGRFGFDARAHLTEASPLATAANADRLRRQWSAHWPAEGAWCLEKSPANLLQARFLQALFPDASFVFLLRHPVAVTLAVRKWSRIGIYALLHHWLHCHLTLYGDLPRIQRYCIATYEELSACPEKTLKVLYDFLQVEPRPPAVSIAPGINAAYFRTWREQYAVRHRDRGTQGFDPRLGERPNFRGRVRAALDRRICRLVEDGPWKGRYTVSLVRREAQDAVEMFEEGVNTVGYSLLDLDRHPQVLVHA